MVPSNTVHRSRKMYSSAHTGSILVFRSTSTHLLSNLSLSTPKASFLELFPFTFPAESSRSISPVYTQASPLTRSSCHHRHVAAKLSLLKHVFLYNCMIFLSCDCCLSISAYPCRPARISRSLACCGWSVGACRCQARSCE
jgi:hypothetical protein